MSAALTGYVVPVYVKTMGLEIALEPVPMVEENEKLSSPATGVSLLPYVQIDVLVE